MTRLSLAVALLLFPIIALSDSALSFAPPPSDYSVVFLSNLFGVVDGVLHGKGSQILGSMFAVFNAAVLALGGMIIMYTLIVSTLNTAQEGEMLGKKWSSIWIPVRSTIGLALLIPKASGYCLMQIFVMWVVIQGVGAADKVWDAALSYLNRGGVIIQGNGNPAIGLTIDDPTIALAKGANAMLASEVCMIGLQTQLQNQRQMYLSQKGGSTPSGPCAGTPNATMEKFCNTTVPSFIDTVNVVDFQKNNSSEANYKIELPNFPADSLFNPLNGICGTLRWNKMSETTNEGLDLVKQKITSISENELETARYSRAIAIQQMYIDLSMVAEIMVRNNPGTYPQQEKSGKEYSGVAVQQFGVPQTINGTVCIDKQTDKCILWGSASQFNGAPLFNGTEFRGAIMDYNGIMLPTLTLIKQASKVESSTKAREFIREASSQGWIMAGSYFFNLITLNVKASEYGNELDSNTGLDGSTYDYKKFTTEAFGAWTAIKCGGKYGILCTWFNSDPKPVISILQLIDNQQPLETTAIPAMNEPDFKNPNLIAIDDTRSSTVYGFTTNTTVLKLPNQPGSDRLKFADGMNVKYDPQITDLPTLSFNCGEFKIWGLSAGCMGRVFGEIFYNGVFVPVFNAMLVAFKDVILSTLQAFLLIPLLGMAEIFKGGLNIISTPGVNPIVALAQMGTYYINFASNYWVQLILMSITRSIIPIFGPFIFALMMMGMPLLMSWLGIMVAIGFNTAYYVPMLPYMIFTFGAVGWLMSVIESMVAAPIVALAVTHPEGHEAFGKGETAIMILLNVFLRPSMMIIGYIAAIGLSYVSVWIINAGFDNAIGFIQGSQYYGTNSDAHAISASVGGVQGGYKDWAGIYAYFFSILVYTTIYITVVTKAFTLIATLPDKVLRWVGGSPESYGTDTSQWGEEVKGKVDKGAEATSAGKAQVDKAQSGYVNKAVGKITGQKKPGGDVRAEPGQPPKNNSKPAPE